MSAKEKPGFLMTMAAKGKVSESSYMAKDELAFRVAAVRNKLLAIWVAERVGKDSAHIPAYINEVIASDLEEPGDEDVIRKLTADFKSHGIEITRKEIETELMRCEEEACSLLL